MNTELKFDTKVAPVYSKPYTWREWGSRKYTSTGNIFYLHARNFAHTGVTRVSNICSGIYLRITNTPLIAFSSIMRTICKCFIQKKGITIFAMRVCDVWLWLLWTGVVIFIKINFTQCWWQCDLYAYILWYFIFT